VCGGRGGRGGRGEAVLRTVRAPLITESARSGTSGGTAQPVVSALLPPPALLPPAPAVFPPEVFCTLSPFSPQLVCSLPSCTPACLSHRSGSAWRGPNCKRTHRVVGTRDVLDGGDSRVHAEVHLCSEYERSMSHTPEHGGRKESIH